MSVVRLVGCILTYACEQCVGMKVGGMCSMILVCLYIMAMTCTYVRMYVPPVQ